MYVDFAILEPSERGNIGDAILAVLRRYATFSTSPLTNRFNTPVVKTNSSLALWSGYEGQIHWLSFFTKPTMYSRMSQRKHQRYMILTPIYLCLKI